MEETKSNVCGIIMPIGGILDCNESHRADVLEIIKEVVQNAGLEPRMVSDANNSGIIQKRIVQNLYDNPIAICDVSCKNPNVMFELGMRLAFDKPTIIIKDDKTDYSFDTGGIEHLSYPRDLRYQEIISFKDKLLGKITGTLEASQTPAYTTFLKHFGSFQVPEISEEKVSKEDYIISSIEDLKDEMRSISRLVRHSSTSLGSRNSRYPSSFLVNRVLAEVDNFQNLYGHPDNKETFNNPDLVDKFIAYLEEKPEIRALFESPENLKRIVLRAIGIPPF